MLFILIEFPSAHPFQTSILRVNEHIIFRADLDCEIN